MLYSQICTYQHLLKLKSDKPICIAQRCIKMVVLIMACIRNKNKVLKILNNTSQ